MSAVNGTVRRVGAWLALVPIGFAAWWFFGHVAQAETQATEQAVLKEVVIELKAIHVKLATAEEAEAALLDKLCREGKLPPADCPVHPWTTVPPVVVPE